MNQESNKDIAKKYYASGLAHAEKGELERAIADYTQAIALKPDYADAYYKRSKAWLRLGEIEKAKADMKISSNIGISVTTASEEILHTYQRAWKTLGNL